MIASSSSLLAASSLLLLLTTAQQPSPSSPPADPYSKFILDANALLASATGPAAPQLAAIYTWQATETAIPSDALDSQYQDYLNAYITTTSAPLPAFVTAIPPSLQPVVSSFLVAEASLVALDLAPVVSEDKAAWSAALMSTASTTVSTRAPGATASSGVAVNSANATMAGTRTGTAAVKSVNGTATAPITTTFATATGSATKSVTPPPKPQTTSGAEKKPAGVALVAAIVGIAGMMVLL